MIKNYLRYAVATAFFIASGASNTAFAETETSADNNSVNSAQRLMIGNDGRAVLTGKIGVLTAGESVVDDVDFYSFFGQVGDKVTINIDGADKATPVSPSDPRRLDAVLVLYRPNLTVRHQVDNLSLMTPIDSGSVSRFDPRMDNVELDATGTYFVGVTGAGRAFLEGGLVTPFVNRITANGSYTLIVEGASPSGMTISIDISPGRKKATKINPKSKRNLAVALLGSKDFTAKDVDRGSVRFGPTGTEASGQCGKDLEGRRHDDDDDDDDDNDRRHSKGKSFLRDVDRDGYLDLICRFEVRAAGFELNDTGEVVDTEGVVKGTYKGMPFEGKGWLKVIPGKKKRHHDDD